MSRPIDSVSRQAAIDALIKADYEFTGILSEPRARMFERTINGLPPAQSEPKWIPVSEKAHPTKEGRYLVTDDAGGMATVDVDYFVYCDDGSGMWLCSQNVTAWMPAPKSYREEGNCK